MGVINEKANMFATCSVNMRGELENMAEYV